MNFDKFVLAPKSILDRIAKYDQNLVNIEDLAEKDKIKEEILNRYEEDPIKSSIENSINSRDLWAAKKRVFPSSEELPPAPQKDVIEERNYVRDKIAAHPNFSIQPDGVIAERGRVVPGSNINEVIAYIDREPGSNLKRPRGLRAVLRALATSEGVDIEKVSRREEIRDEIKRFVPQEFFELTNLPI